LDFKNTSILEFYTKRNLFLKKEPLQGKITQVKPLPLVQTVNMLFLFELQVVEPSGTP